MEITNIYIIMILEISLGKCLCLNGNAYKVTVQKKFIYIYIKCMVLN